MRHRYSWVMPDLALVAASVTLFYCLFFSRGYQQLFRDSDAGWHIRTGEAMLATGHLPRTDPYSFTKPRQPWFAWEWAVDAATGVVHRAGGLRAVALFYGVAIAAGVWMWFRLHWIMGGNFLIAAAMSPMLLSACSIHWLARPHVLGWLLLLGLVWWFERGGGWLGAGLIAAAWANVHASFFLAPVVAGVYALRGAKGQGPGARNEGPGARGQGPGIVRRLAAPVAVTLFATLLNPYGWHLHRHLFHYLTDSELLARIGEFQSFDFHSPGAGQIIAALIIGVAGGTLALTQGRVHHFVLAMMLSAMALRSARALPLAALIALPIANAAISEAWPWKEYLAYGDRLRAIDMRMHGLALVPLMVWAAWAVLRFVPVGFAPDQFPVAAYAHLDPASRLFAPDKFGGYLIYRSNGVRKVYFDGRSDFYGAEFLKQYARMMQVRPGWLEYWNSWHFTQALLPRDMPLIPALEAMGWRPVYQDGTAVLLERGGT